MVVSWNTAMWWPRARHHCHHIDAQQPQDVIGFLSDIRCMNVGMTCARRKLLLVGDSSTLCRHPFFGELRASVKEVGGYRTALEVAKKSSL
jgi:superfamily I DNA and/or RNA helicase